MNNLQTPYDLMLNSLSNVLGFKEYCDFLKKRISLNNDWKAEIKSLFEINKYGHPLERICSFSESEPEGIFKFKEGYGFIEAAFIGYLFNMNYEKNKTINKIKNILEPLKQKFVDKYKNYLILLFLKSIPTDVELKYIKEALVDYFKNNKDDLFLDNEYFVLEVFESKHLPTRNNPDIEIGFALSKNGILIQSANVRLDKKIINLIKTKRKQHKIKYNNFIKIYYFLINCPPPRLEEINECLSHEKLHDDEILILSAISYSDGGLKENKKIFGIKKSFFDLSNNYYALEQFNNKNYIEIPFSIY